MDATAADDVATGGLVGPAGHVGAAGPCVARRHMADLQAAAALLAADSSGATEWSGPDRHAVFADLTRTIDALTATRAAVLIAERDADTWRGHGDPDLSGWAGRVSRLGKHGGTAQVRQATELDTVPDVVVAVTEGRIPLEHATIIAKIASAGTPAQRDAATSTSGQEALVELAETQDAGTFGKTADRWAATLDPEGLERDHQAQYRARYFQVSTGPNGSHLKGLLDAITGQKLTLALEAVAGRPGINDDRDFGQRNADALTSLALAALGDPTTKPGAHVPPQISLILTEATWIAAQADRERRRASLTTFGFLGTVEPGLDGDDTRSSEPGRDGGDHRTPSTPASGVPAEPGEPGEAAGEAGEAADGQRANGEPASYAPATLEDGTPVAASELSQLMCDCELTRIVVNADGVPLDLGRTERLFTGPQRKAVIARDRECAVPGCTAHARWCNIHHLAWWTRDGGVTSVENGVLLCNFHHHEVHRLDLTLTRHTLARGTGPGPGPGDTIARVRYEFHDRAGRPVWTTRDRVPRRDPGQDPGRDPDLLDFLVA
ncbi:HNH endonuclease signature motif containing protein [Pengzhenrongella frigida]|uniref:HNH endonuclease n=1 Tax=Pengzhenrongella frigida TaxID=1259133 RepID=A0A4Q5MZC2_9MICO|nr:HNH endonuclease signature motif containing protein [Cellulomonas sp. HLT2-17]RYV51069.1 HNH endonuclease [Cellulomonas sp. HLT2-17]